MLEIYQADPEKLCRVGVGYNSQIFESSGEKPKDGVTRIVFCREDRGEKGGHEPSALS